MPGFAERCVGSGGVHHCKVRIPKDISFTDRKCYGRFGGRKIFHLRWLPAECWCTLNLYSLGRVKITFEMFLESLPDNEVQCSIGHRECRLLFHHVYKDVVEDNTQMCIHHFCSKQLGRVFCAHESLSCGTAPNSWQKRWRSRCFTHTYFGWIVIYPGT